MSAYLQVEACVVDGGDTDVAALAGQLAMDPLCGHAVDGEGDDAAAAAALVVHVDTSDAAQLLA
jgi:hypothetical protein